MESTSEVAIEQDCETDSPPKAETVKEGAVVSTNSDVEQTNHYDNIPTKEDNVNSTINNTVLNIDTNIQAQENITALKERELELLKKQQELAREIERQKMTSQKLSNENQFEQKLNNQDVIQESRTTSKSSQPITNISKYSTIEEKQDNNIYSRKFETFEKRECTNVTKNIDLQKIFTPATDAEEILPKNRKLYASSAFYSPALHPTVEDQVELARRISHSLSDISNQQSRGQSMYVNRKKRSVKWVHEGSGQGKDIAGEGEISQNGKENDANHQKNTPLKFLMNPYGQMHDINSLRESITTETGLLSPDVSAEVVNALQTQSGKGAALFAKRRKFAEKWVVDESNVGAQSPSGLPDYYQYQQQPKISTSPSILPAYTDAAKHRVQLNMHQEQLLEKYAKPGLKVVQTPWEAALTSGSASAAFIDEQNLSPFPTSILTPSSTPHTFDFRQGGIPSPTAYNVPDNNDDYHKYHTSPIASQQHNQHERQPYLGTNSKRELAYKPSIPQGWKAPSMYLPKDLYMPKDIPLQSYAPPPVTIIPTPKSTCPSNISYQTSQLGVSQTDAVFPVTKSYTPSTNPDHSKPYQQGFTSTYGSTQPPKRQILSPQSYQRVEQNTSKHIPQVNFNPSSLPYEKLAKFENPPPADECRCAHSPSSRVSYLNVRGSKVRNTSPVPFASSVNRSYTHTSDGHYYGGTRSISPRPYSSPQRYSRQNTPNFTQPIVTSNHILNAPSYNNSARGWGSGSGGATSGYNYQENHLTSTQAQTVNTSSIPYTDF